MATAEIDTITGFISPSMHDGELRIHDIDLATRLGFDRPRDVRKLIKRYLADLKQMGVCATVAQTSSDKGGRPSEEYYLNKKQAIFITAKSETRVATEVTIEIIERFDAYERGEAPPVRVSPTRRPSILRTFRTAIEIGRLAGFNGSQLVLRAGRYCKAKCGENPLELMGTEYLTAAENEHTLTPSQIGQKLGRLSARHINQLLLDRGLQTSYYDKKGHRIYHLTAAGRQYGRLEDTSRAHSGGNVTVLRWYARVIHVLRPPSPLQISQPEIVFGGLAK
ncbi:DNA-binding protein [Acetobacteraceae bacterium EV16G]|uniref:DNA-binding protein n=1 Tax=Sorlinia euscelidii TaxID=3081148 RepID=A0ABU7U3D2_9PROT